MHGLHTESPVNIFARNVIHYQSCLTTSKDLKTSRHFSKTVSNNLEVLEPARRRRILPDVLAYEAVIEACRRPCNLLQCAKSSQYKRLLVAALGKVSLNGDLDFVGLLN